ncbi:hypothetical protein Aph02nite_66890 [Actinoplanes philippinensis]|nr:hypothetical protein Aph02nite_66890 [Actinoplanes philippinensis]
MTRSLSPITSSSYVIDGPLAPLQPIANRCTAGNCPTVYVSEAGGQTTAVVQGHLVDAERAGVPLADGEVLVRIPLELLTEAALHVSDLQRDRTRRKEA